MSTLSSHIGTLKISKFVTNNIREYTTNILSQFLAVNQIAQAARLTGLDPETTPEQQTVYTSQERLLNATGTPPLLEDVTGEPNPTFQDILLAIKRRISANNKAIMDSNEIETIIKTIITYITNATSQSVTNSFKITTDSANDTIQHLVLLIKRTALLLKPEQILFILLVIEYIIQSNGKATYNALSSHPDIIRYYASALDTYNLSTVQLHHALNLIINFLNHLHYEIIDYTTFSTITARKRKHYPPYATIKLLMSVLSLPKKERISRLFKDIDVTWLTKLHLETKDFQPQEQSIIPISIDKIYLKCQYVSNIGIGTVGINPVVFDLLDHKITSGVQVSINNRAYTLTSTSLARPPLVKLKSKSIVELENTNFLKKIKDQIEYIISWGEVLVSPEDLRSDDRRKLYTQSKWIQELKTKISNNNPNIASDSPALKRANILVENPGTKPSADEAVLIAETFDMPIHPSYHYGVSYLTPEEILTLRRNCSSEPSNSKLRIHKNESTEHIIEKLLIPAEFEVSDNAFVIKSDAAKIILYSVNDENAQDFTLLKRRFPLSQIPVELRIKRQETNNQYTKSQSHVIFPVGTHVQNNDIILLNSIPSQQAIYKRICNACSFISPYKRCPLCNSKTIQIYYCNVCRESSTSSVCQKCGSACTPYNNKPIDITRMLDYATKKLNIRPYAPFRGINQVLGSEKEVERLEKGILRQKHNLYVFKDGTTRFAITNAPLTTFTPKLINTPVQRLKELGYSTDIYNHELTHDEQILYLKPQDVILSFKAADHLRRVSDFVDEELSAFYSVPTFYNIKSQDDLIGHLIVSINEENDFALVGRIIGFTELPICLAHPVWHLSKGSRCSGTADQVTMLLDALLNYSKHFLSSNTINTISTIQPTLDPDQYFTYIDEGSNIPAGDSTGIPRKIRLRCEDYIFKLYSLSQQPPVLYPRSHSAYFNLSHLDKIKTQILISAYSKKYDESFNNLVNSVIAPTILQATAKYTRQQFKCKTCNRIYRRQTYSGVCTTCGKQLQPTVTLEEIETLSNYVSSLAENVHTKPLTKEVLSDASYALQITKHGKKQTTLTEFT